ncbi:MAG: ROK family protein [Bacteroidota bacterium]
MSEPYVLGFDVGGTRIKSGAVRADGTVIRASAQPSGFLMEPPQMVEAIHGEVQAAAAAIGNLPHALALAFPGVVAPDRGVVRLPGKLKGLEGYPIVEAVREATGVPTTAENDGRVAIIAEARHGQARDVRWAVTITIGTGVGSGVMLDGHVLRDPHLQFGNQLGHFIIQSGGKPCITGARGTAETLCSATALAMAARDGLARGFPSVLTDRFAADPSAIDFKAVVEAAQAGDTLAEEVFADWKSHLGALLVTAIHAYAPERIILSGGATNAAHAFLDDVRAYVARHTFRYPKGEAVPIVISELRDHAGVLGAGAVAWDFTHSLA